MSATGWAAFDSLLNASAFSLKRYFLAFRDTERNDRDLFEILTENLTLLFSFMNVSPTRPARRFRLPLVRRFIRRDCWGWFDLRMNATG
jgi:hypothetical protein